MKKKNSFFQQLSYASFARVARKVRQEEFWQAESYAARDRLCRFLAAEAYGLAERYAREGEEKLSLQYMKLAARLLGLSLKPKKLGDIEEIKRALANLKDKKAAGA